MARVGTAEDSERWPRAPTAAAGGTSMLAVGFSSGYEQGPLVALGRATATWGGDRVEGIATGPALDARTAAAGAERLARRLRAEAMAATPPRPEVVRVLDDLDACARTAVRLTARFGAGGTGDDPAWEVALATVAQLNLRRWRQATGAAYAEQMLLMEVLERLLTERAASGTVPPRPPSREGAGGTRLVYSTGVERLIAAARLLPDPSGAGSAHALVGVAVRAMRGTA